MESKIVLAFSGQGANDAIRGLMADYGDALASIGLSVVHVSTDAAEIQYAVERVSSNEVAFALSFMGIAQDLMVRMGQDPDPHNLWEAFDVPLVKLYGDLPAYFVERHSDTPRNAVNLYHASEFIDFRRRWLPELKAFTAQIPPLPMTPLERSRVDLKKRRTGRLVFLKNGNSPNELRRLWRERLAPSVADRLERMAEALRPFSLRKGPLLIGDAVAEYLQSDGVEPVSAKRLVLFFSAQLDDYFRRVKSLMIAETLLDFPVLIQGGLWEHLDVQGKRATLVQGQDFDTTQRVYSEEFGIVDMSANVDSWPHDRIQRAAGSFALPLTNEQSWLTERFPGFEDLTFEFTPESIRSRVTDVLAHQDRYLELGVTFGEKFRQLYPREEFARRLAAAVDLAALQSTKEKPHLQPFYVWPRAQ